jgi:hypothetical protein
MQYNIKLNPIAKARFAGGSEDKFFYKNFL